jgi:hypothetical protein
MRLGWPAFGDCARAGDDPALKSDSASRASLHVVIEPPLPTLSGAAVALASTRAREAQSWRQTRRSKSLAQRATEDAEFRVPWAPRRALSASIAFQRGMINDLSDRFRGQAPSMAPVKGR